MTSRERLTNTLDGRKADRIPVWTHIPFGLQGSKFVPAPFHGYANYDDWRGQDPAYRRLVARMEAECDNLFFWGGAGPAAEHYPFGVSMLEQLPQVERDGKVVFTTVFRAPGKELRTVKAIQPGSGHTWVLEHYCKGPDDARLLLELPWEGRSPKAGDFRELAEGLGERGMMVVGVLSPMCVVCRLFDPTDFLILSRTERSLIHRLCEVVAERTHKNLEALLQLGLGPIVRFGGAEHATPPMMSPDDFDDFVVRYDRPLMDLTRKHGCLVAVHCHGRIRHALGRFVEMGVSLLDPTETVPDGDITLSEARSIAAGQITLAGNIQVREMATCSPEEISSRVRQVIEQVGPDHLIVTITGTPLERISPELEANYNAFIDAAFEHGRL